MENRVGYVLKRVQQALRAQMDEALAGVGLTLPQYAALSALEAESGLSNSELARRGFVTAQTMNDIVANLEKAGLVARRAHPTHGRVQQLSLTAAGREAVGRAHPAVATVERRMLAHLAEEERASLLRALQACARALEGDAPDHPSLPG